jgi:hypothetical protein
MGRTGALEHDGLFAAGSERQPSHYYLECRNHHQRGDGGAGPRRLWRRRKNTTRRARSVDCCRAVPAGCYGRGRARRHRTRIRSVACRSGPPPLPAQPRHIVGRRDRPFGPPRPHRTCHPRTMAVIATWSSVETGVNVFTYGVPVATRRSSPGSHPLGQSRMEACWPSHHHLPSGEN